MTKIWLTYAWRDNEDENVDHVIQQLQNLGMTVGFDRAHLLAGTPLWRQIDAALADPELRGWAIYLTENSLRSEPCQEELAYALDRTLRTKNSQFKLIGIFPSVMDRELVPSAIATRLHVSLSDSTWAQQIYDSFSGQRTPPDISAVKPYYLKLHKNSGQFILESRPRSGRWVPYIFLVPIAEREKLKGVISNPKDYPNLSGMAQVSEFISYDKLWSGFVLHDAITPDTSAYCGLNASPSMFMFGPADNPWTIRLAAPSGA